MSHDAAGGSELTTEAGAELLAAAVAGLWRVAERGLFIFMCRAGVSLGYSRRSTDTRQELDLDPNLAQQRKANMLESTLL